MSKNREFVPKILELHSKQNNMTPNAIPANKSRNAVKQLSKPNGNPLESGQTWGCTSYSDSIFPNFPLSRIIFR